MADRTLRVIGGSAGRSPPRRFAQG